MNTTMTRARRYSPRAALFSLCGLVLASLAALFATQARGAAAQNPGTPTATNADTGVLPAGSELGDEAFERPRELFRSETRGGRRSYRVVLGQVAFNSPLILGEVARRAGISCETCHVDGTTNSRLYIPGLSTRGGNFDTTSALFNPKADDGVLDPLTIPSLRGAHGLAPYGHDGRTPSLRDFVRNVIVGEFAGLEPSNELLDAMVDYVEDIDFVHNPRLGASGELTGSVSEAERRGAALFHKPFPHDPDLSCAACHPPSAQFVDHRQHDVGTGGAFKTPPLLNANLNAPYFHDGRYANYDQVVAHFDRVFYLGLSARDRRDLVSYLQAVGDGEQAVVPDDVEQHLAEMAVFTSVLDTALPEHDGTAALLTLDTLDSELRELTDKFPDGRDLTIQAGADERRRARGLLKAQVLEVHEMVAAVHEGQFDRTITLLRRYRERLEQVSPFLHAAQPWSLFNKEVHDAHYVAVRGVMHAAVDPALGPRQRVDLD